MKERRRMIKDTTASLREGDALFERLCTREEQEAFVQHRSKRMDADELANLKAYVLSDECVGDLQALLAGKFDFPLPRRVLLRKGHSDRRRTVYVYPERQKNLMKYIAWGMLEYDGIFCESLLSFRKKKGAADAFRSIAKNDYARRMYVAKADVHDYGHSIRPELLKPMIEEIIGPRDPALQAFLVYLLDRGAYISDGKPVRGDMGGLPGVPLGSFFNNVYLSGLDSILEQQSVLYCRYADDIAVFTATLEEAQDAIATIRTETEGLGLTLNEEKTQVLAPGEPIELLGIAIRDGHFDVSDHTLSKARSKLSHYADKLVRREQREGLPRQDAAGMMARRIDRYFYHTGNEEHELSWRDFFFGVLTRPDSLHYLDVSCQDLLRRVATGKRGGARYRFRYEDIRALGYRPLVHEYYRYREDTGRRAQKEQAR